METIIVVILCIVLAVFGAMTLGQGFMTAADITSSGVEEITVTKGEIARTAITVIDGRSTGASTVELVVANSGQVKLSSYDKWDIIVDYYDNDYVRYSQWLQYTEGTPGTNEWLLTGIYQDASSGTTEAFEPNVLNPAEELKLELQLDPPPRSGSILSAVVITLNGVSGTYSIVY